MTITRRSLFAALAAPVVAPLVPKLTPLPTATGVLVLNTEAAERLKQAIFYPEHSFYGRGLVEGCRQLQEEWIHYQTMKDGLEVREKLKRITGYDPDA